MKKRASVKRRAARVTPIPSEFRTITSYLVVNNAVGAIEFYKTAFRAKELQRNLAPDGKVMNAQIRIGNSMVMISDEFPGSTVKSPSSLGTSTVTLHMYSRNVDEMWSLAVSAGATIVMPLENQFWGERYGQLVDPFGHHWSLSQRIKMSTREIEEKKKAAMEMFASSEHSGKHSDMPSGVG